MVKRRKEQAARSKSNSSFKSLLKSHSTTIVVGIVIVALGEVVTGFGSAGWRLLVSLFESHSIKFQPSYTAFYKIHQDSLDVFRAELMIEVDSKETTPVVFDSVVYSPLSDVIYSDFKGKTISVQPHAPTEWSIELRSENIRRWLAVPQSPATADLELYFSVPKWKEQFTVSIADSNMNKCVYFQSPSETDIPEYLKNSLVVGSIDLNLRDTTGGSQTNHVQHQSHLMDSSTASNVTFRRLNEIDGFGFQFSDNTFRGKYGGIFVSSDSNAKFENVQDHQSDPPYLFQFLPENQLSRLFEGPVPFPARSATEFVFYLVHKSAKSLLYRDTHWLDGFYDWIIVEDSTNISSLKSCIEGQTLSAETIVSSEPFLKLVQTLRKNIPETRMSELDGKLAENLIRIQSAIADRKSLIFLIDVQDTSDLPLLRQALFDCGGDGTTGSEAFDFSGLYDLGTRITRHGTDWYGSRPLASPFSQLRIVVTRLSNTSVKSEITEMSSKWVIINRP